MSRPPVIEVEGLTKRFGRKTVVDHVSMTVGAGRITGFLGPNGSGKTTVMRMLTGLLTPDAGRGRCLGFDLLKESAQIKEQVGYMTQRFSLYEDLSIAENLAFVAGLHGLKDKRARVADALARLGLEDRRRQLAGQLSGGWKQRLALAASLIHAPKLLLLDEPTAGVDPKARRTFWDEIHKLVEDGLTVLVSTHYMDEAERCHDIVYIAYGKVLARGGVKDVVDASELTTWIVRPGTGDADLAPLARALASRPGIAQVTAFGASLHVVGSEREALAAALAPLRGDPRYRLEPGETSLEDVFIQLMGNAVDNAAPEPPDARA